ncbi:MAG: RidA family protein [Microbacterium sp.]
MPVAPSSPSQALTRLGIVLPAPRAPRFSYRSVVVDGGLAYVSGALAIDADSGGLAFRGRLGEDLDADAGRSSARQAAVSLLGSLHHAVGGLDRVEGFVKLVGFVRSTPDFGEQPFVVDGASDLLGDVFGRDRLPARSAIGVAALPGQGSVELEGVARLRRD